jgi:5-oxoprolinase (ATP-hydrolysing)
MPQRHWQFFIDVGGTFTDVVARRPDGKLVTHKLLSSGAVRGAIEEGSTADCILDSRRIGDPVDFWAGYAVTLLAADVNQAGGSARAEARGSGLGDAAYGSLVTTSRVKRFDSETGRLFLEAPLTVSQTESGSAKTRPSGEHPNDRHHSPQSPIRNSQSAIWNPQFGYALCSGEEAPVAAIRYLMGLRLTDAIGAVDVRLGTTRATNALLERKGAKVALVTTKGFADVLKIGNQDRPKLFELDIKKRDELTACVVEIDERLSAAGEVLRRPDEKLVRSRLERVRDSDIEALALCLLHAHVNPEHEAIVAEIAESVGFAHVSVSSRVARLERLVPRGDTTVVDAYLAPVIGSYVASLRRSMPDARLKLVTSSGGLVDAARAAGKDTILSGPAGGVVGCAHVARQAGLDKTIGFDMGGTSTDVSRIESENGGTPARGTLPITPRYQFEYQYETVKAGVRIMTPMLAVETVAAGGGSICAFDGQKLTVGPESAGADPGPACYGRGGPLTVTDMNVFLGRVVPEYFPFRLDRSIVERRLTELSQRISGVPAAHESTPPPVNPRSVIPNPQSLGSVELAEGFIQIANANMASAIKRISLAKGYDVREYALTTFGGAGAQHACAIARMLGMSRVLCSPFAGVLSAVGIGAADVKRIGQRSVCQPLDSAAAAALEPVFESLTKERRDELIEEGVDAERLSPPIRTMDVCYTGQASLITIPADTFGTARERFEALHHQLYGYTHEGRAVEIRVARVELGALSEHIETRLAAHGTTEACSPRTTDMFVEGKTRTVPLHLRDDLTPGVRIAGPAVVIEETSTIVVDAGWEAVVHDTGDIVLSDRQAAPARQEISKEADPIQLELFNNQFVSIAEQMGTMLRRTALSVNVKERLDFSCALFTPEGDLVVNAPHIPVHLGGMSDCVKALMEDVGAFSPGDVYITNDPYRGGSHLNDVTVITPVHDQGGWRILFLVASRAHHAEIGGTKPGSMPSDSTSLAEEGVVIHAFRWIENDRPQHERLRDLLTQAPYPSRTPDENLADIAAQVAANQTGVRELRAMIARYDADVVHAYMKHIQTAAERKMREALSELPDGTHRFEDCLDDGSPIRLAVTIAGDRATLDFSGTGPVHPGNLNANRAIVTAAALYCLRCLIREDIPLNAGVLAPVEIVLPECLLNPPRAADPRHCAAVVGGNVEISQRIVDCIFGALETVAGGQGTMNNLLIGTDWTAREAGSNGSDSPLFGYYETICGGAGAGPGFHGADAVHTHMTNTRLTDPEVLEARVPVRLWRFEIRRGSGGRGRYRGGCGVIRELEFLAPLDVSILSQRRTTAPYGLAGGEPGKSGRNLLRRAGAEEDEVLPPIGDVAVRAGDRLTIETPGGGGWGTQ